MMSYTSWPLYDYYEVGNLTSSSGSGLLVSLLHMPQTQTEKDSLLSEAQISQQTAGGALSACIDPLATIAKAIRIGTMAYNRGAHLSCFFLYHAVAQQLAECEDQSQFDMRGLMEAAAATAELDSSAEAAAWRLRRSFDAYVVAAGAGNQVAECSKQGPWMAWASTKSIKSKTMNPSGLSVPSSIGLGMDIGSQPTTNVGARVPTVQGGVPTTPRLGVRGGPTTAPPSTLTSTLPEFDNLFGQGEASNAIRPCKAPLFVVYISLNAMILRAGF